MRGMWKYLTPFSPDTSGFCSVVSGTDGAGILDDPQGCVSNYLLYEEDRKVPERVFNSRLTNTDVILGTAGRLLLRYEEAARKLDPAFVLLGGSPVSALIGTDLEDAAQRLSEKYGVPCAGVSLTGDTFYQKGVKNTYLAIAELLFNGKEYSGTKIVENSVNLLGLCPLDIGISGADEIKRLIREKGIGIVSAWGSGTGSLKEMENAGLAEKNLVISADAVPLAKFLEHRFKTPWESCFPYETGQLPAAGKGKHLRCLVLGEPFTARGIRDILKKATGSENVFSAGFFYTDRKDYDYLLKEEKDLLRLSEEHRWDMVIGDPEYKRIIRPESVFIPLVHRAVSGNYYGRTISEYPDEQFWKRLFSSI